MARVILKDDAANMYSLFAAKLSVILGRPAKYNEAAKYLNGIDDEMLTALVGRQNALDTGGTSS
jgi:hypothetical protein